MPPKRTIQSFFTASSKRSCQHIGNETAADEGEVVGAGEADKNGMSNFIFSLPTFYFALRPLVITEKSYQCMTDFFILR